MEREKEGEMTGPCMEEGGHLRRDNRGTLGEGAEESLGQRGQSPGFAELQEEE